MKGKRERKKTRETRKGEREKREEGKNEILIFLYIKESDLS